MKSPLVSYCLPKETVSNVLSNFMPSEMIEPFNRWLSRNDAVISGSATTFMVAQAQKVPAWTEPRYLENHTAYPEWTPGDLDIWILPKDEEQCDDFLEWFSYYQFALYQFSHRLDSIKDYDGVDESEFNIATFKYPGLYGKIRIMILTTIEPKLYIIGYFDLTVVHNYWDGTQLYSAWTELTCNNRMMEYNIIKEDPKSDVQFAALPKREERIIKYQSRGFQLVDCIIIPEGDKEQWEQSETFRRIRLLSKEQLQQSQRSSLSVVQDEQENVCSQLAVFDISDEVVMG